MICMSHNYLMMATHPDLQTDKHYTHTQYSTPDSIYVLIYIRAPILPIHDYYRVSCSFTTCTPPTNFHD